VRLLHKLAVAAGEIATSTDMRLTQAALNRATIAASKPSRV
jgi:hypothetical protein